MLTGPVLNSDQAAAYCGLRGGAQVLRNMKLKGEGPQWHKVGSRLVYRADELDVWLRERVEVAA